MRNNRVKLGMETSPGRSGPGGSEMALRQDLGHRGTDAAKFVHEGRDPAGRKNCVVRGDSCSGVASLL